MAIGWLTFLKIVPWGNVIASAPVVVDGARKLWQTVRQPAAASEPAATAQPPDADSLAALRQQLARLEAAQEDLHRQMLASSELIRRLAEQNALLVRSVEAHRRQLYWLAGSGLAALLALGLLLALR